MTAVITGLLAFHWRSVFFFICAFFYSWLIFKLVEVHWAIPLVQWQLSLEKISLTWWFWNTRCVQHPPNSLPSFYFISHCAHEQTGWSTIYQSSGVGAVGASLPLSPSTVKWWTPTVWMGWPGQTWRLQQSHICFCVWGDSVGAGDLVTLPLHSVSARPLPSSEPILVTHTGIHLFTFFFSGEIYKRWLSTGLRCETLDVWVVSHPDLMERWCVPPAALSRYYVTPRSSTGRTGRHCDQKTKVSVWAT